MILRDITARFPILNKYTPRMFYLGVAPAYDVVMDLFHLFTSKLQLHVF